MPVIAPGWGAVVMGTGVVSVALAFDGHETLSRILLVACAAVWAVLACLLARAAVKHLNAVRVAGRSPAALTGVAGTAVLGTRIVLLGWDVPGAALLVISAAALAVLLGPVLRHLELPTTGSSLLITVAIDSIAAFCAVLAGRDRALWLLYAALFLAAISLGCYAILMARFEFRQLASASGDHWVAGGALAISCLAIAQINLNAHRLSALMDVAGAIRACASVIWALAMAWLVALVAAEALSPRLRYALERWATIFPLGMYAASSFALASVTGSSAIGDFAQVWTWVAFAAWILTAAGTLRDAFRAGEREGSP